MGYDQKLPATKYVYTHARAFHIHTGFSLVGAYDPDANKRKLFQKHYKKPVFSCARSLLDKTRPEVVIVASPTSKHKKSVTEALVEKKVQAILCEKPLAEKIETSMRMVKACKKKRKALYVNFIRRADAGILEVKKRIKSGRMRNPFQAVVWYSKGLLHNGSHFVDLLTFLLGPIQGADIVRQGRNTPATSGTPCCRFDFKTGSTFFLPINVKNFLHNTCEIIARNGRLRIEGSGEVFWQEINPHPHFLGRHALGQQRELLGANMGKYQLRIADQLYRALQGQKHTLCTGQEALKSQKWIEKVLRLEI